jgi:arylsulfatase A
LKTAAVILATCAGALHGLLVPLHAAAPHTPSPQAIILIMADDLGYHSLPVYGCDAFRTPNLDRLAGGGMVMTRCHARAMCVPTRTVLLGGRTLDRVAMGSVPDRSMAAVLSANGYYCGFTGKWMQRGMPWNHGFAEGLVQVNWYKYYGPHFVVFNSGGYLREHNLPAPLPEKMLYRNLPVEGGKAQAFKLRNEYGPEVLNRFALDFIDRYKNRPFFLYYPLKLPHAPVLPTPDSPMTPEVERLLEKARDLPVEDHGYSLKGGARWRDDVVAYIDKMVGRLLAKLDATGLRDKTLVVFTSDNGPGTDGAVRKGIRRLPGMKGGVLEGATRIPCLLSWPAVIRPGSVYEGLVDFTDFLPTFAELTGGEIPAGSPINGISFANMLGGHERPSRRWVYIHDGWHPNPARRELYDGHSWGGKPKALPGQPLEPRVDPPLPHIKAFRYVRGDRFKLYSDGRFYDLVEDLHERHPIGPDAGSPEAEGARLELRGVLARFPQKDGERTHTGSR